MAKEEGDFIRDVGRDVYPRENVGFDRHFFRLDREDRNIYDPLPRPDWRKTRTPERPNRQYDRYFPRSAKR